jgi:hypothetical protein
VALTWLGEPTVDALRAALRVVAPELADGAIVPRLGRRLPVILPRLWRACTIRPC